MTPSSLYNKIRLQFLLKRATTPLAAAVAEIKQRHGDVKLREEVETFLEKDVPEHFRENGPIFYLSRYIATPDFETLEISHLCENYGLPLVIGEDTTDIFTSHSTLKRNLMKLPIVTGVSKNGSGIIEYKTIVDFNSQQGKSLGDIQLLNGNPLHTFHQKLCAKFLPKTFTVVDESAWVNRHSRGQLVKLYESMLALLIVHGVMLEQYETCDNEFLTEVVIPAMKITKQRFGYKPLIAQLPYTGTKAITDVNSYPALVGKYIENNNLI